MSVRLFAAVEVPRPLKRKLAELQEALKKAAGRRADDVRFTDAEQIHVTLHFLGAVPEERVDDVKAALAAAAASCAPFALASKGAGGFPNQRRPRVLWAGIEGETWRLAALAKAVGERLAPIGYPPEARPFTAHLTLGRSRDPRGAPGLAGALAEVAAFDAGLAWRVEELVLFQSHLSPKGATYEAIGRFPLGG